MREQHPLILQWGHWQGGTAPIMADCFVAVHTLTARNVDDVLFRICCRFAYLESALGMDDKWLRAGWKILRSEGTARFMRWG